MTKRREQPAKPQDTEAVWCRLPAKPGTPLGIMGSSGYLCSPAAPGRSPVKLFMYWLLCAISLLRCLTLVAQSPA